MAKEHTLYDDMTSNGNQRINVLRQDSERLRAENADYRKTIEAIEKSNPSWNEGPEDRNEIRFYEGAIRANDAKIKANEEEIAKIEEELRGISGIGPHGNGR